jgi:hypothetical protein
MSWGAYGHPKMPTWASLILRFRFLVLAQNHTTKLLVRRFKSSPNSSRSLNV